MTKIDSACEPCDDDIFVNAITDEALEAAASVGLGKAKVFSVSLCTVLADCSSQIYAAVTP